MFHRVLVLVLSLFCCGALAVTPKGALAVNSKEPYRVRLVRGQSQCQGELQVQRRGQGWIGVSPWLDVLWFGDKVCAALDCGSVLSMGKKILAGRIAFFHPLLPDSFENSGLSSFWGLVVNCSDSVRLVSGRSLCSGSLQIRDQSLKQSWTPVCEGGLDRRGAEVLCRELNCGVPVLQGALSPLGQMFHCEGHESSLMDCPRNQTRNKSGTCSPLHLTCSVLRLVGGASRCEGAVEVLRREEWRPVTTLGSWNLEAASVVCRELDCGSAVSIDNTQGSIRTSWHVWGRCLGPYSSVRDCFRRYSTNRFSVTMKCSDSVRLVSGLTLCSGFLQIRDPSLNQSWTPVCEGALDRRGAEVLCRELDCGTPVLQGALSPPQMFHCEGHESALMNCPRNQTRTEPGTCSRPTLHLTCSEPLRLVGGPSRCEGTVELKYRGEWRRAVPIHFPGDLAAAAAVCRDLDCGFVVSAAEKRGLNSTEVWDFGKECSKMASVKECVYNSSASDEGLEVVCSDSVRFASGGTCSGSLQIRDQSLNQSWTTVCEGALDRRGAEVLCREMRCGAPLLQGALSSLGQMFHCEGHESSLMDCPRNQTRNKSGTCSALHLTCSDLKLVGGASRCQGAVEVLRSEEWKPVTALGSWNLEAASLMCQELDCGSAVYTDNKQGPAINSWLVDDSCLRKKNASVRDCIWQDTTDFFRATVICSDSVRLVSGRTSCSGSLLIRDQSLDQSWTPVCEGALDRRGAEVLCREMGCGAPLLQGELSPPQVFHCEGHESALMNCPRNQTRTEPGTCSGPTLHLSCSEPLRLVGGTSRCEGTVELKYRGEWRRAVPINFPGDLTAADAVCRDLDCGSVVSAAEKRGLKSTNVWKFGKDCAKTASVKECVYRSSASDEGLEVVCSDHKEVP